MPEKKPSGGVIKDEDKPEALSLIGEMKTAVQEGDTKRAETAATKLKTYVPAEHHGKVDELLEALEYASSPITPQEIIQGTAAAFADYEKKYGAIDQGVRDAYEQITKKMNEFIGISATELAFKKVVMPMMGVMSGLANAPAYYGMSDEAAHRILQSTAEAEDEEGLKKKIRHAGEYYKVLAAATTLEPKFNRMLEVYKAIWHDSAVNSYAQHVRDSRGVEIEKDAETKKALNILDKIAKKEKLTEEDAKKTPEQLINLIEKRTGVDFNAYWEDHTADKSAKFKSIRNNLANLNTFQQHVAVTVDSYYKYTAAEEKIKQLTEQIESQKKLAEQQK